MRVSTVNSATSLSFSRRNKQDYYDYHPPITYDTHKVRNTLLCLAGLGLAGLTIALVKDSGNNMVKSAFNSAKATVKDIMPEPTVIAVGNKRNTAALNRYNSFKAKEKLSRLETRIANGEFKDLPEHAIKNIEKQKNKLIKQCTQKI